MSAFNISMRRLNWYQLYLALAAFEIVVLVAGLLLANFVIRAYSASIEQNSVWADRLDQFSELSRSAAQINAPANDIFEKRDIQAAGSQLTTAHDEITKLIIQLQEQTEEELGLDEANVFEYDLNAIENSATGMVLQSRAVIDQFASGQGDKSAPQLERFSLDVNHFSHRGIP